MFKTTRRLRFGDCDPSGIAYFPSYLDLLVQVVEEFFDAAGISWTALFSQRKIGTPTVTLNVEFARPGFHGDQLDFAVRLVGLGRSSMDLEHAISCDGALLWSARQRIVATSLETHKAKAWPDDIRSKFASYLESNNE